ncbi:MAG: serine hydrolase [Planctomycetales bacterium]|nr:serine hydrolase [Planctomycetales bacterium]
MKTDLTQTRCACEWVCVLAGPSGDKRQRRPLLELLLVMATYAVGSTVVAAEFPGETWTIATPQEVGLDSVKLLEAREYALAGGGSGYITRAGKLVLSWGDVDRRYDLKSTTKSFGATALGVALQDGKMSLNDLATKYHPRLGTPPDSNRDTGWIDQITVLHLATQTAGFEKLGGYTPLVFEPGTKWSYSDGGPNWLAECITLAYRQDVDQLMFDRVFTPIGITRNDLRWRRNSYRDPELEGISRREFGSGISANVDAMARLGLLYLRGGMWQQERILPKSFVRQAGTAVPSVVGLPEVDPRNYGNASDHYGLLWWNNADGTLAGVPRDAYWSWGLYDSLIVVIPSLDLVVARAGQSWKRENDAEHYQVLKPFLEPIVAAVIPDDLLERTPSAAVKENSNARRLDAAPYPPSLLISGITWAPTSTINRRARGSDNWPMTWADDDHLYTAYGDGRGFEPFVDVKLSMGLARLTGSAADFRAENVRSASFETRGDGPRGKKASGLLMVDGTLYVWVRNVSNSQLGWSTDHGTTWTWSDWKLKSGFGAPTFLNYGRDYAGARDGFVYSYSHDSDSAYDPSDRMVLARVPADRIRDRAAYTFFAGWADDREPLWTSDIALRAGVFTHVGGCYRSGISYNAALKRYLWCQTIPGDDTRFEGGLAIYEAPEPWGPWSTVYYTERWDVGPGETSSIPTKWISQDGCTFSLVFSGDDCFSVRQGVLKTSPTIGR